MINYQRGEKRHPLDPIGVTYNGHHTGTLMFQHLRWGYYPVGSDKAGEVFGRLEECQENMVKLLKGEKSV